MKDAISGAFEKITDEALKHGTAGFFQGVLGMIVAIVLLTYSGSIPDTVELIVQITLIVFLIFSTVFAAGSMLGKAIRSEANSVADDSSNHTLPDYSREIDRDFGERLKNYRRNLDVAASNRDISED